MILLRNDIIEKLPYGEDFCFLNSANIQEDVYAAEGRYTVPTPHESSIMRSHFPALPIFPGFLQGEIVAQLAALLMIVREGHEDCSSSQSFPILTQGFCKSFVLAPSNTVLMIEVALKRRTDHSLTFKGMIYAGKQSADILVVGRVASQRLLGRLVKMSQKEGATKT